jgi:hypothetical protein
VAAEELCGVIRTKLSSAPHRGDSRWGRVHRFVRT